MAIARAIDWGKFIHAIAGQSSQKTTYSNVNDGV